ncbi:MAG TPA: nuclear transport factor 2 family protein [Polyangiaceae bacterium]|nr:nuclear transport factor 2 family protein [Polyangiaceae bacterium]
MRLPLAIEALVGVLLTACSSETVAPPPAAPIDWHAFDVHRSLAAGPGGPTARERGVAEAYAAALSSPGFESLAPRLDGGVHFTFPGMAADARGRDAVVRAHESLFGAFAPRQVAVSRVWRTDSAQALEWTLTGTQSREWQGTPPTDRRVAFDGLTLLWTKDDGSITDVHVYFDVAVVRAQLGAGPKELAGAPGRATPRESPQVFEQSGSAAEASDLAAARSWLDALEAGQETAYAAAATDAVELFTPERAEPLRGKSELSSTFRALRRSIGQLDTTVENGWGVGSFVVLEYSISGEQLAPIDWVPLQRDRVVRLHVADVLEMQGGKIARVWRYDNPAEIVTGGNPVPSASSAGTPR